MRKTALRIRQTAAHIPGIFGLLSEQPRRILHYKGIYHQLSATLLVVSAKCRLFLRQGDPVSDEYADIIVSDLQSS